MNKKIKNVWCIAVCLIIAACTGEDTPPSVDGTPLQVELQSLQPTRTAITATTLPDGSQYGIYVTPKGQAVKRGDNGFNIPVSYKGGKSTMSREYILQPTTDYHVYAAFPQENSSDEMTMQLETASQTDYLYGYAVDSNGELAVINQNNPVAKIQLRHALALLKFNIFQSEDNKQENIVTEVLTDHHIMKGKATLNLQTGELTSQTLENTCRVKCQFTAGTTPQTVEMLILPCNVLGLFFRINDKLIEFSRKQVLQAGNCYTYNVEIQSDGKLLISEATITPRDNTIMDALSLNVKMLSVGGTVGIPVDLRLSVKWADHNVGASSESEVGGRYLWGDPTGTATSSTYSQPNLTEISGTKYDIATVQWGSPWRLPTYNEIKELVDNTSYVWTSRNGTYGGLFTSKKTGYTNKSIFIPYYGAYYSSTGIKFGDIWTGTLSSHYNNYASKLDFSEEKAYSGYTTNVSYSKPIRPVCK